MKTRLSEIDALRGLAVLLMITYHLVFQLHFLGIVHGDIFAPHWTVLARITQWLFLLLVGVGVELSSRTWTAQLSRAWRLFCIAMGITGITAILFPNDFVFFGVLHLITVSILLAAAVKPRTQWVLIAIMVLLALTAVVRTQWPLHLASLDFFHPLPWLVVPLLGLLLGKWLYAERRPTRLAAFAQLPGLTFLGQHSLLIYCLHIPLIYAVLILLQKFGTL